MKVIEHTAVTELPKVVVTLMDNPNSEEECLFPQLIVTANEQETPSKYSIEKENQPGNGNKTWISDTNGKIIMNQVIGETRRHHKIPTIMGSQMNSINTCQGFEYPLQKRLNISSIQCMTPNLHDSWPKDNVLFQNAKLNQNRKPLKRSKSERIQRNVNDVNHNNNNEKGRSCLIESMHNEVDGFLYKNESDLPREITQRKHVLHTSGSDSFISKPLVKYNNEFINSTRAVAGNVSGNNNKTTRRELFKNKKLGDRKALIDKYMNPEPVIYQSDLSFLFKDKSLEQVASTLGNCFATWNKRQRTAEELNMLDLGNTYKRKKRNCDSVSFTLPVMKESFTSKSTQISVSNLGLNSDKNSNSRLSDKQGEQNNMSPSSSISEANVQNVKTTKKVFFNEDTTEILDIHEIEAPIEFAVRVGKQSMDVLSNPRDSTVSTPVDSSFLSTPVSDRNLPKPKPILKRTASLEPENINWADCYQLSSGEDSDVCSDPESYNYHDYIRDTRASGRLSLPTLPVTGSLVSGSASPKNLSYSVSPRNVIDRHGPRRSRSRGSTGSNGFQCSKEFALVLQNLDSSDEEN